MSDNPADEVKPLTEMGGHSLTDMFETDPAAEESGRWFNKFMGEHVDLDVKIRSFGSAASVAVARRMQALYSRLMSADGSYPVDVQVKITCQQMAEAVIVDWRGKDWRMDSKSEPMVFSQENALIVLTRFKPIRNRIAVLANNYDAFRTMDEEATTKN
jgi:hypothetical protein